MGGDPIGRLIHGQALVRAEWWRARIKVQHGGLALDRTSMQGQGQEGGGSHGPAKQLVAEDDKRVLHKGQLSLDCLFSIPFTLNTVRSSRLRADWRIT